MRYFKKIILLVIMSAFICLPVRAEMTLKELFFDESKPFHLKILDVIPEEGKPFSKIYKEREKKLFLSCFKFWIFFIYYINSSSSSN